MTTTFTPPPPLGDRAAVPDEAEGRVVFGGPGAKPPEKICDYVRQNSQNVRQNLEYVRQNVRQNLEYVRQLCEAEL